MQIMWARGEYSERGALQLANILDDYDPVIGAVDLGEQRGGERRLAGSGAAGVENVHPPGDRMPQRGGGSRRHDARVHIVVECENGGRRLADGKGRRSEERRVGEGWFSQWSFWW